jgi:hypothetical protein
MWEILVSCPGLCLFLAFYVVFVGVGLIAAALARDRHPQDDHARPPLRADRRPGLRRQLRGWRGHGPWGRFRRSRPGDPRMRRLT